MVGVALPSIGSDLDLSRFDSGKVEVQESEFSLSELLASVPFSVVGGSISEDDRPSANFRAVSPGYLETMRISLREGRLLEEHDRAGAPPERGSDRGDRARARHGAYAVRPFRSGRAERLHEPLRRLRA